MSQKKYNALDPVLQSVLSKCIRLSDSEKKMHINKLHNVLDGVISKMKEVDCVFECLYRTIMFTGSYYENLRISKPDEFDINLIFDVPIKFKVKYSPHVPGFVQLKFEKFVEEKIKKHIKKSPDIEKGLRRWISDEVYFSRNKFRQWMQGVFDKALQDFKMDNLEIKPSSSGPALTLKVTDPPFSVDLVPVLEFNLEDWPPSPVRKFPGEEISTCWYTVPKAPEGVMTKEETYWRMSFYNQEKDLMNGLHGMKPIIKLFKLLRENKKWKFLSSYAIKTLFLWENDKNKKTNFWQNGIGFLFVHMLQTLADYADKHAIPFYWDKNLNLLKVSSDTTTNMKNCLVKIVKRIDNNLSNPSVVLECFGMTHEGHEEQDKNIDKLTIQHSLINTTDNCPKQSKSSNLLLEERKKNHENSEQSESAPSHNDEVSDDLPKTLLDISQYQKESNKLQTETLKRLEIISSQLDYLTIAIKRLQAENDFMRKMIEMKSSSVNSTNNLT